MRRRLAFPPVRRAVVTGLFSVGGLSILCHACAPVGGAASRASGVAYAAQPVSFQSSTAAQPLSNKGNSAHARAVLGSDTVELADLQQRFTAVADHVAPSVVAISASVCAVDSDDAVRSEELNGQRLQSILDRVTRTVGTGMVI